MRCFVTGRVTRGAGRGAGLGFPTANVPFAPGVLVPAFGVYRAEAEVDGVRYPACVNIGVHPTVGALPAPLLEANLIGFAGNLYGKELAVWLQVYLRGRCGLKAPRRFAPACCMTGSWSQTIIRNEIGTDRRAASAV